MEGTKANEVSNDIRSNSGKQSYCKKLHNDDKPKILSNKESTMKSGSSFTEAAQNTQEKKLESPTCTSKRVSKDIRTDTSSMKKTNIKNISQFRTEQTSVKSKGNCNFEHIARIISEAALPNFSTISTNNESLNNSKPRLQDTFHILSEAFLRQTPNFEDSKEHLKKELGMYLVKLQERQKKGQQLRRLDKFNKTVKALYKECVLNKEEVKIRISELKNVLRISEPNSNLIRNEQMDAINFFLLVLRKKQYEDFNFERHSDEILRSLRNIDEIYSQGETARTQEPRSSHSMSHSLNGEQDTSNSDDADMSVSLERLCYSFICNKFEEKYKHIALQEKLVDLNLDGVVSSLDLEKMLKPTDLISKVLLETALHKSKDDELLFDFINEEYFSDLFSGSNNRMTQTNTFMSRFNSCLQTDNEHEMTKHNEALMNRKNQDTSQRNNLNLGDLIKDKIEETKKDLFGVLPENSEKHLLINDDKGYLCCDINGLTPSIRASDNKLKRPHPGQSKINGLDVCYKKSSNVDVLKSCPLPAEIVFPGNDHGIRRNTIIAELKDEAIANKVSPPYQEGFIALNDDKPGSQVFSHVTKNSYSVFTQKPVFPHRETSLKKSTLDAVYDVSDRQKTEPEFFFDLNEEDTGCIEGFQEERNVFGDGFGIIVDNGDAEIGTNDAEENIEMGYVDNDRNEANMIGEHSDFERENENTREEDLDPDREITDREESVENTGVEEENVCDLARGEADDGGENVEGGTCSSDAQRENSESIRNTGLDGEEDNAVDLRMAAAEGEARENRDRVDEVEANAEAESERQIALLPDDSDDNLSFLDLPFEEDDEPHGPMESFMFSFPGLEVGATSGLGSLEALMADSTLRVDVMLENVIHQMLAMQPDLLDEGVLPANPTTIDQVPEVTVNAELLEQNPSCPICLCENQMNDAMSQLPCQHVFHPVCLRGWLVKSGTCPVCRRRL